MDTPHGRVLVPKPRRAKGFAHWACAGLIAATCLVLVSHELGAAPGDLDQSWGTGGKVLNENFGQFSELVVQPDGRTVAGGKGSGNKLVMTRYLTDGRLDPSFGAGGKVEEVNIPPGIPYLIPDGKILV
ncbi:MAG: delta-60 repeat domain-containing protein, partial [Actinomycetota bacterium]